MAARGGAVWRALLDSARSLEEARDAARGLEEALRSDAFKTGENASKRRFLAARGGTARERNGFLPNRNQAWSLGGRGGTLQNAPSNILRRVASSSS